jgi:hypothetical protein
VYIPAGSKYNCTVSAKIAQKDNLKGVRNVQVLLALDNQVVASPTILNSGVNDWKTVGGAGVANAQDMHTIIVLVQPATGFVNTGTTIAIDNLQCFPTGQCAY